MNAKIVFAKRVWLFTRMMLFGLFCIRFIPSWRMVRTLWASCKWRVETGHTRF